MRGQKHSDDTKAAVMAALLTGQGVEQVAKDFNLPVGTVGTWKKQVDSDEFEEVRNKTRFDFGAKLGNYLNETLTTLTAQAIHFRDTTWLKQQSASELAVLHGVQADKAIRLLEAIERAAESGSGGEPGGGEP